MRLRQAVLAAAQLDATVSLLCDLFELQVAFKDPSVESYGLQNAVLPVGRGFVEIVSPIHENASAARFLTRRGGDAGYMVILQVADLDAESSRLASYGLTVVDQIEFPHYRALHFHPADFGGVLVSLDQQLSTSNHLEPYGDWAPAGPDWRAALNPNGLSLASVTLSSPDPVGLAEKWSRLLGYQLNRDDGLRLPLDMGEIRFVHGESTGLLGIGLNAPKPTPLPKHARAVEVEKGPMGFRVAGTWFEVVEELPC